MSALGIGLAWAAMAAAAFLALSATAPARTRNDLEADPENHSHARAHGARPPRARAREAATEAYAQWPQATHTASLRSSPSAAYMHASAPVGSSPGRFGTLGLH